eukprot:gnl/Hemi2/19087_TR6323_c0_g1_i1.p1 gnl/Hemi2/19087_TR6323_c0_g1~~gnl/Hemi2/19087_TR6323_c0_g1_i1.p1  ORF type:complete len:416 (-),score=41.68 gnl/Hemi2/19087_TR6323_c0_g1_i1:42-1289(-)
MVMPLKTQVLLMKKGFGPPIVDVRLCDATKTNHDGSVIYPSGYQRVPIWTSDTALTALIGNSRKRNTVLCYARDLYLPPVRLDIIRQMSQKLVRKIEAIAEVEVTPPRDVSICTSRRDPSVTPALARDWTLMCEATVMYRTAVFLAKLQPLFEKKQRASREFLLDDTPRLVARREFAGFMKRLIARRAIFSYLRFPHLMSLCTCDNNGEVSFFAETSEEEVGYLQYMEDTLNDRSQISLDFPVDVTEFYEMLSKVSSFVLERIPSRDYQLQAQGRFQAFDLAYKPLISAGRPEAVFLNYQQEISHIVREWQGEQLVTPYQNIAKRASRVDLVALGGDLALALLPPNSIPRLEEEPYLQFLVESISASSDYAYLKKFEAWACQLGRCEQRDDFSDDDNSEIERYQQSSPYASYSVE